MLSIRMLITECVSASEKKHPALLSDMSQRHTI